MAAPKIRPSFYKKLTGALAYPVRGWGIVLLLFGSVLLWACYFSAQFSLRGIPVAVAVTGYYFSFLIRIVNKTADGDPEIPNWPSITVGLIQTFFMMLGTILLSFSPVILYWLGMFFLDLPFKFIIFPVYMSFFILPMAVLRVAIFQTIEGLNPAAIVRSIAQVPTAYMVACLVCFFIVFTRIVLGALLGGIPLLGGFITTFVALYFSIVEFHILGLIYYAYQERFDWFRDI